MEQTAYLPNLPPELCQLCIRLLLIFGGVQCIQRRRESGWVHKPCWHPEARSERSLLKLLHVLPDVCLQVAEEMR